MNWKLLAFVALSTAIGDFAVHSHESKPKPPQEPRHPFKFQSNPVRPLHAEFIQQAIKIILNKGLFNSEKLEKLHFMSPDELRQKVDFSLGEEPVGQQQLLSVIETLFDLTGKPAALNRLNKWVAGLDPLAVAGDWMVATLGGILVVYDSAPIWTLMEIGMTKYLSNQIGWNDTGDGVSTSGAGVAGSMALAVAVHHLDKRVRDIGLFHMKRKLTLYISKQASLAWKTAAIYNGFGLDSIVEVDTDDFGRMDPIRLDVSLGLDLLDKIPVMVVATAGTPTLGVIDRIDELALVCAKYGVWLHVEAELAGGWLFTDKSEKFRRRLRGIERADSVAVSMWLFQAPYSTSMLLTKDPTALQNTFGLHADYLFDTDGLYNSSYDLGDHTIQTSRRPEIGKMWFAAARGQQNIFDMFSQMEHTKTEFGKMLRNTVGFITVPAKSHYALPLPPEGVSNVPLLSFYYEPVAWRGKKWDGGYTNAISNVTNQVFNELRKQGLLDLSLSYLPKCPAFFTLSFTNTVLNSGSTKFFQFVITTIQKMGEGHFAGHQLPDIELDPPTSLNSFYPNFPEINIYGDFLAGLLNLSYTSGIFFKRVERLQRFRKPEFFEDMNHRHFDFSLPQHSAGDRLVDKLIEEFKFILKYSPHRGHPYHIYHLQPGLDPYTIVADFIAPLLNTPLTSYNDISAPFLIMEKELVKSLLKRIYKKDGDAGDGIVTDGGSMSNQIAIAMAKYYRDHEGFKEKGCKITDGRNYIIYISADAHYSTKKGAMLEGIGQNNTIEVEANQLGQMNVDKLEEAILKSINAGDIPLMVVITTGTTVYGAVDPIRPIVDVCIKFNIWCHADGALGGLMAMSTKYIKKYKGIQRTDSWSTNLHKLTGSAAVSSILLTPHAGYLRKVFKLPDERQEEFFDKIEPDLNLVGRHVQSDKKNNILKFWLIWKAKGRKELGAHIDKLIVNKNLLMEEIRKRKDKDFGLILEHFELPSVCFFYVPPYLNPKLTPGVNATSNKWRDDMDLFTAALERAFMKNGIIKFITQTHQVKGNRKGSSMRFLKVILGSGITPEDIRYLLDTLAYYGKRIKIDFNTSSNDVEPQYDYPFGNLADYYPVLQ